MADIVEHTQAMIDYLLLDWARDDADDRARMLSYLQAAENEICGERGWWFFELAEVIDLAEDVLTYAVSGVQQVRSVRWVEGGRTLDYMAPYVFQQLCRNDDTAGDLYFWTDAEPDEDGLAQFSIWQRSINSTDTLEVHRSGGGNVLADATDNVSRVPKPWRMALVHEAARLAAQTESDNVKVQAEEAARERVLTALRAEDAMHGQRSKA